MTIEGSFDLFPFLLLLLLLPFRFVHIRRQVPRRLEAQLLSRTFGRGNRRTARLFQLFQRPSDRRAKPREKRLDSSKNEIFQGRARFVQVGNSSRSISHGNRGVKTETIRLPPLGSLAETHLQRSVQIHLQKAHEFRHLQRSSGNSTTHQTYHERHPVQRPQFVHL